MMRVKNHHMIAMVLVEIVLEIEWQFRQLLFENITATSVKCRIPDRGRSRYQTREH